MDLKRIIKFWLSEELLNWGKLLQVFLLKTLKSTQALYTIQSGQTNALENQMTAINKCMLLIIKREKETKRDTP